jgi:SAM-dependent methyltransferase
MKQTSTGYAALASVYDCFTQNMQTTKRADYISNLLIDNNALPGDAILDLACGTGLYTYELLVRGYDVIGVDASAEMLLVAREKAAVLGTEPPLLLCQQLEELDLFGTAKGAVCLTDSVNHLTNERVLRQFFKRLALFLEPGSPFVFDVNTLYKHEHVLSNNTFIYEDDESGAYCVWRNAYASKTQTTQITLDVFTKDENGFYIRRQDRFAERAYSLETIIKALEQSGFAVRDIFGELNRKQPQKTEERVFFVAIRE